MNDPDVLEALRGALERDPRSAPLWLLYGTLLAEAGRREEATGALRLALEDESCRDRAARRLVPLLRAAGALAEALIRVEALVQRFPDDAELRAEHARVLEARGAESAHTAGEPPAAQDDDPDLLAIPLESDPLDADEWAKQFDWDGLVTTFADVAGLEEVKRQVRLKIVAPFKDPALYRAFGRSGGGGILMYGPPGCGKTFLARAVAGECKARFVAVGIHEIVDKFFGESEKLVHALFEEARRRTPTVLFFDEFDALGGGRGRVESHFWKTLVDQILQEMDGIQGRNEGVLLLAATNMPWNVDTAFRRPGRFDRVLFVPPPDETAREEIVRRRCAKLPGGARIDARKVARATSLFSGADLVSLCERASERALELSMTSGKLHEVSTADLLDAAKRMRSSTEEWIGTARSYARYSNEGGQYDELAEFLRAAKKW